MSYGRFWTLRDKGVTWTSVEINKHQAQQRNIFVLRFDNLVLRETTVAPFINMVQL